MNAIGSGGFKCRLAPRDSFLHGGSPGNPAADFVSQPPQIGLKRRRLKSFDKHFVVRLLGKSGSYDQEKRTDFGDSHRVRIRNENGKKGKSKSDRYFLSSIRTVSSVTIPTISRLLGLSLSTVSCVVCQKTLP